MILVRDHGLDLVIPRSYLPDHSTSWDPSCHRHHICTSAKRGAKKTKLWETNRELPWFAIFVAHSLRRYRPWFHYLPIFTSWILLKSMKCIEIGVACAAYWWRLLRRSLEPPAAMAAMVQVSSKGSCCRTVTRLQHHWLSLIRNPLPRLLLGVGWLWNLMFFFLNIWMDR